MFPGVPRPQLLWSSSHTACQVTGCLHGWDAPALRSQPARLLAASMTQDAEATAIQVPQLITPSWVLSVQQQLDRATRAGVHALKPVLPQAVARTLLERAEAIFKAEPTLIELNLEDPEATVSVVGDTHGQFHDVCKLFTAAGYPSDKQFFIFNGDFVDRGAWGLETLVLLLAWKLALPGRVFLTRGNHESATCTVMYGFKEELKVKYGKSVWQEVYTRCKRVFASLPLAALVQSNTLVLHGGLFRQGPRSAKGGAAGKNKRKRGNPVLLGGAATLGTLDDLRAASRGGMDPSGVGSNRLASDVLWSDPTSTPGFSFNISRGIGMMFGPDVTERFLRDNNLRLVLRSHEGPDAREGRNDMPPMTEGYTLDHDTPAGKLMTVFSAPEYPQFVGDEAERCHNKAAVAVLAAPDYATPRWVQFEADLPRPEAQPYYQLEVPDSDEEFEPAASDISGMSAITGDTAAGGSIGSGAAGEEAAAGEVDQPAAAAAAAAAADQRQQTGEVVAGQQQQQQQEQQPVWGEQDAMQQQQQEQEREGPPPAKRERCEGAAAALPPCGVEADSEAQQQRASVLELFSGVLPPPQEGNASAPSSTDGGSKEDLGGAINSVGASKDSSLGLSEGTEATGCEAAGGLLLESERGMAAAQPVEVLSGGL